MSSEILVERFSGVFDDASRIIEIASENFSGMKNAQKASLWIQCNSRCFPRMQYFIAILSDEVVAYILWVEKGGFRMESVWELEQIAVKREFQGRGIGTILIKDSFIRIQKHLCNRGAILKTIEVTTGVQNEAQKLYVKAFAELGYEIDSKCVVKDLFRGDEVMLFFKRKLW